MKKYLFILLLFPLFGHSQTFLSDSSGINIDSQLVSSTFYNPKENFFNPILFPINIGQVGFNLTPSFNRYGWFSENIGVFYSKETKLKNTLKPYALAKYGYGYEDSHWLSTDFSMKAGETNINLKFNRIASEANLPRGDVDVLNFLMDFSGNSNYYGYRYGFNRSNNVINESGGLNDKSTFLSLEEATSFNIESNLQSAVNELFVEQYFVDNEFYFFKKNSDSSSVDSLKRKFGISVNIDVSTTISRYSYSHGSNDIDSGYYPNILLDSSETFDSIGVRETILKGGVNLVRKSNRERILSLNYGIVRNDLVVLDYNFIDFEWRKKKLKSRYELKFNSILSGIYKGSIVSRFNYQFLYKDIESAVKVNYKNRVPHYFFQNFTSNHYSWINDFNKIQDYGVSIVSFHKVYNLQVEAQFKNLKNWIFFDNSGPIQNSGTINYFSGKLKHSLSKKWYGFHSVVMFQNSSGDDLPLPSFWFRNSGEFKFRFNKVPFSVGYIATYFSKFKGQYYNPALRNFVNQNNVDVGGFPIVDSYFAARVGPADLYLKVENMFYMTKPMNYFLTPNMPISKGLIRFGFKWKFNN